MTKQNILIINFNSLYEILDEIKVNLSFNIVKHDNEDDFIKYNYTSPNNFLIITKSNKKILTNKNLTKKNFLDLSIFPLSINKLIELINIQLIKLKFNLQAKVIINGYELNLNSKFLFKDNLSLKLTEKEIEIILYLNENRSKHDVLDLQKNIWGYSAGMETHTVETHIYRLRKKLSNKFNDAELILTDPNGYFIN
ncbi:helix-turn-helix domain-containing protein [Candidatus Pelagibacter sp.]|nr:helix-turn-helix domain-containing protein [Candidatus Pelagibacter sp.]